VPFVEHLVADDVALKVSDAAVNSAIDFTPASIARSRPFMFGTRTGYSTPGSFGMFSYTSAVSAICGTHFGLTNAPASITRRPASPSAVMYSTFAWVGIVTFSF